MKKGPFILYLAAGFFITLVTLYGHSLSRKRAGLPFEIRPYAEKNLLVQIDDIDIRTDQDIEFIFCRRKIGDSASFYVKTDSGVVKKQGKLAAYYAKVPYPSIYLVTGLFLIVMAFVVFLLRPQEFRARIFFWASLVVSCTLNVSGGFYCLTEDWLSYIPGILFYMFYPLSATLVLHFSLSFLRPRHKAYDYLIYLPAVAIIVGLEYHFLLSAITSSIDTYRQYQSINTVFRGFFIFYLLLSIFVLILSYRKADSVKQKAQIKWILYGIFFGVGPLVFLYQFPRFLIQRPLISEELAPVFLILIPVAFAVSILRFKLMNVELVINRSLVYSILTVFSIGFYLLFVQILQAFFSRTFDIRQSTISVIGALAVALAFNPARKRIQEFVDRSFFRSSYDYKKSILSFNERAHRIVSKTHLVDFFLLKVNKTLPLDDMGLRVFSVVSGRQKVLIERGNRDKLAPFGLNVAKSARISARRKSVLREEGLDFSIENAIEEKNLDMIIPLPFRSASLAGYVVLGQKKSGAKFSGDDVELLLTLAETFALNLERIHLQEEVICERAEKEKYDELNRMKTEFISNVSHEIRTPMSSIHSMSEILQQGKIKGKEKQEEILDLMADECSRLSRFLHNILDYGKIEQSTRVYNFKKTDVSRVLDDILNLYAYRLRSLGFSVKKQKPENPVRLKVDPDAIRQALTNLIDNAIKYSSKKREIGIAIVEINNQVEIQVQDKGIGIPEGEQEKIFNGFYRADGAQQLAPRGVGLGLKIVKTIMKAHGGDVRVDSRTGKGSTFSLIFKK